RTRLRFGKGQRARFVIRVTDERVARQRKVKLTELAAMLTAAGKTAEAPIILRKGAEVISDKDFAEVVRFTERRCAKQARSGARPRGRRPPIEPWPRTGGVYFVAAAGKIKIGVAKSVAERLRSLQTGCPEKLQLLAVADGDGSLERAYHQRFGDLRVEG